MIVLLHKLSTGTLFQNFTPDEIEIMKNLRESKDTILAILHHELSLVHSANAKGQQKIQNLVRTLEKICR